MSFLSSSISSSSLSSSSSTSPLRLRQVYPTYLPTFATHSLYAAILANPAVLHAIEDLPLFQEDLICQELVRLFHDVVAAQRYHALSAPHDLPADFGVPLRMALARLPDRILSILHLHGFHSFVERIPPCNYLPYVSTYLSLYDHGTSRPLHRPIRTPASPIPISDPRSSASLSHYIFARTTLISCPIRHVFFPNRCRPRIWLR